jgi:5'-3' exonuclease
LNSNSPIRSFFHYYFDSLPFFIFHSIQFIQKQLVFPAASYKALPPPYANLMLDPRSPIADFYPSQFHLDTTGINVLWLATVSLPFIDFGRLRRATQDLDRLLTLDELRRNSHGENYLFTKAKNMFGTTKTIQDSNVKHLEKIISKLHNGVDGLVTSDDSKMKIQLQYSDPTSIKSTKTTQLDKTVTLSQISQIFSPFKQSFLICAPAVLVVLYRFQSALLAKPPPSHLDCFQLISVQTSNASSD